MNRSRDRVPLKPLKWYKNLAALKGRRDAGAFIIEGDRAIRQIVDNHPDAIIEIVSINQPPPAYRHYPVRLVTESQFRSLCSSKAPQGILAVVGIPADNYSNTLPDSPGNRVLLLEDIQDPGNVGTIIRTAAAFDFNGVILTEKCADPFSPKCVQSTAGSVLAVWLRRTKSHLKLVESLRKAGYTLIAADLNGREQPSVLSCSHKLLLALGNEAAGLSASLLKVSDYRIKIPIARDKAESLNVAISGAILMYLSSSGK